MDPKSILFRLLRPQSALRLATTLHRSFLRRKTMQLKKLRSTTRWIFVWLLLVASSLSPAQGGINTWTTNGPEGGLVKTLAIDPTTPSTLYAATYAGGVFKSTNSGGSWSAVNTGLVFPYF